MVHTILTPTISVDENALDFVVYSALWRSWRYIDERKAHASQLTKTVKRKQEFFAKLIEKIILNLSDQLLLTGTAVLIAGFSTHCSISVYHFTMIGDLAWFASSVHLVTIVVLLKYLQDRPVLRNWRAVLMSCMAVLLTASTILQGHRHWDDSWPYDAQCVFNDLTPARIGGSPAFWMYWSLAFIIAGYLNSIIRLYQTPQDLLNKWLRKSPEAACYKFIGYCETRKGDFTTRSIRKARTQDLLYSFLIACAKITFKCYIYIYGILTELCRSRWLNLCYCCFFYSMGMSRLFEHLKTPQWHMGGAENAMTFGQIVPILLLGSTLLVAREAYDGSVMLGNASQRS